MNTTEKLNRIKEICSANLEIAAKRSPGRWYCPRGRTEVFMPDNRPVSMFFGDNQVGNGNASFVATCAGSAEAAWKATIAAIDGLQRLSRRVPVMGSVGDYREGQLDGIGAMAEQARLQLDVIISAWEEQLS